MTAVSDVSVSGENHPDTLSGALASQMTKGQRSRPHVQRKCYQMQVRHFDIPTEYQEFSPLGVRAGTAWTLFLMNGASLIGGVSLGSSREPVAAFVDLSTPPTEAGVSSSIASSTASAASRMSASSDLVLSFWEANLSDTGQPSSPISSSNLATWDSVLGSCWRPSWFRRTQIFSRVATLKTFSGAHSSDGS